MNPIEKLKSKVSGKNFNQTCEVIVKDLRKNIRHYNWVGIYLVDGDNLVLGAWDGLEATEHTRIPIGAGICGLAAREKRTVVVDDVNADPRYLACFPYTRSEIVVPLMAADGKNVIGEIDIDSDTPSAFGEDDELFLRDVARLLVERYSA
ncbi:GAF domain-containing protein [Candidatus Acetothermia bacterium]|nr:GAF domain-containing protein [Candidatus Acetothermia bacterium]MBI3643219.1 GAF domain-containing protein [Candidatus Acetothermia bacterium]